jgi:hypothetical protein
MGAVEEMKATLNCEIMIVTDFSIVLPYNKYIVIGPHLRLLNITPNVKFIPENIFIAMSEKSINIKILSLKRWLLTY